MSIPLSTRLPLLVAAKIILLGGCADPHNPLRCPYGRGVRSQYAQGVRAYESVVVVRIFLIGCAFLLVVGCAGVGSEAPQKEQGSSPRATQSEEARCEGTRTIKVTLLYRPGVVFTTYDLRDCPKGGLLLGTDKPDKLAGRDVDDEIRGLGAEDYLIGGLGNDVIYGGPGRDSLDDWGMMEAKAGGDDVFHGGGGDDHLAAGKGEDVLYGGDGNDFLVDGVTDSERDKLYCGKGKDRYYIADKNDYVDSSCEKKGLPRGSFPRFP